MKTSEENRGYVRVSTNKQSVERQVNQLKEFGVPEEHIYQDVGTGGNTDREELQQLLEEVDEGRVTEVVTVSVSRISRSSTDLFRLIEDHFMPTDTKLTLISEPLDYDPNDGVVAEITFKMLSMIAELDREMTRERVRQGVKNAIENGKHVGRPPAGFEVVEEGDDKGTLRPAPDYDVVAQTLDLVDQEEVSKRQAAKRLDTSRATINRILNDPERRQMYGL